MRCAHCSKLAGEHSQQVVIREGVSIVIHNACLQALKERGTNVVTVPEALFLEQDMDASSAFLRGRVTAVRNGVADVQLGEEGHAQDAGDGAVWCGVERTRKPGT